MTRAANPAHTPVQRAALVLARAVLRQAGLKPEALLAELPAPERRAPARAAKKQAQAQLVTPVPKAGANRVMPLVRMPGKAPTFQPPKVPTGNTFKATEAVTPDGVVPTICPSGRDTRYSVDADSFAGGDLMAEWRAKRGEVKR